MIKYGLENENEVIFMVVKKFEHVGSFLRPAAVLEARERFAAGEISAEDLKIVEDKAITELVDQQVAVGLERITDGEFRRSDWHLDFFWGFEGISHEHFGEGLRFDGEETRDDTAVLTGPIAFNKETHPFVQHYRFLKDLADERGVEAKLSIPAPSQLLVELVRGKNAQSTFSIYTSPQELFEDIIKAYQDAIQTFYDLGLRTLQLDDCTWTALVDDDFWATVAAAGVEKETVIKNHLYINNGAIAKKPEDLTVNTHVCRGNYHSTYATKGPYDSVADALFNHENAQSYFLEYDDERSGGFEPLAKLPKDKAVVLGLITTKTGELENKETILKRIEEASQYADLDQLWISTQCGFASTKEGNILTPEDQWKKLALVKEVIDQVWS